MHKIDSRTMAPWRRRDGHNEPSLSKTAGHRPAVLHRRTPKPHKKPIVVLGVMLLTALAWPGAARAGINDVPKKVRQGIAHYEAGQFDEAAKAFDEARAKQPDDARVTFDAACAKAAAGALDEAVPLFQQAAVTPDAELAARCHYNLGKLAADRAKAALGEKSEAAEAEARGQARELIAAANGHWRDCLAMQPDHEDARYNIELATLWLDHMETVWKAADRQKRLEKMKLPEMLQWLEREQDTLRSTTRGFDGREPSPLYRLAVHETAGAQRELSEDIDPLKQKITQAINQPEPAQSCASGTCPTGPGMTNVPGAPGMPGVPGMNGAPAGGDGLAAMDPKQREHAIKLLTGLADRAGESMRTASEYLAEQTPADARVGQSEALENLDQITTVITAYPQLVFKAAGRQKELVGQVKPLVEPTPPAAETATEEDDQPKATSAETDLAETAWRQRFVERWTPIIVAKAKQGLEKMPPPAPEPPATPAEETKPENANSPAAVTGLPGAPAGLPVSASDPAQADPKKVDPQEAARKKQENLRKSMELAVKLGPEVQRLVTRAAGDLAAERAAEALPKQQEALKLLEKIAEPLKEPNQNQQNQQNQKQNQDQKKDQNKQNQDKKDQNQKKQDQKKQDKNQGKDDKKDQKQDQNKGNQPQQAQPKDQKSKGQPQQRQPRDLTKQQAQALMQQVQQRNREKEKARKALMEMISRPPKAEKDW